MRTGLLIINGKKLNGGIAPEKFRRLFPEFDQISVGENQRYAAEKCRCQGQIFSVEVYFRHGHLKEVRMVPGRGTKERQDGYRKICDRWLSGQLGQPCEKNLDTSYYGYPWGYVATEYDGSCNPDCSILIQYN